MKKNHNLFYAGLISIGSIFFMPTFAHGAVDTDVDKLTTYATILGRGIACGADTKSASQRIGRWIDKRFPPGTSDQKTYLPVFIEGTRYAAEQQKNGNSPDSCSQILRTFESFPWP